MPGRPIQIAEPIPNTDEEDSERFQFNYNLPKLISSSERLANARVAVISVAGAFRKGKSFLLNFFLRYLTSGGRSDWMRATDELSDGFHWRSGSERDTAGILIWSEPFFIPMPNGEEVAVLLMDTQGTFDHQSTQQDCTTIFAFSTLLSSVQIFNISQNLQETDLQHLRLFVEFAAMAKETKEPVLQHLWFLIRDWQYPDEYDFGVDGGRAYLNKVLACDSKKPRENQELRQGIRRHFKQASCCLLPHPGQAVCRKTFKGEIDQIDGEFVTHLENFVSLILSPRNLVVKSINGRDLTGRDLFQLVEVYFQAFRLGKLPTPKSIFTATVEMTNLSAVKDAEKLFEDGMQLLSDPSAMISDRDLDNLLNTMLEQAMQHFDSNSMEHGSRQTVRLRQKLEEHLRGLFQQQRMLNQLKSDKVAVEKKNEMLFGEIHRMQDDSLDAARKMKQLEDEFAKQLQEIQSKAISKQQMEAMLQEQLVQHSVAQKELEKKNEALMSRIDQMAEMNKSLASELKENRKDALQRQEEMMDRHRQQMQQLETERQQAIQERPGFLDTLVSVAVPVATTLLTKRCCIS